MTKGIILNPRHLVLLSLLSHHCLRSCDLRAQMFDLVLVCDEHCTPPRGAGFSHRASPCLGQCPAHSGLPGSPAGMDPELGALKSLLPLSILILLGTFVTLGPASPALGRKAACRGLRPGAILPAMGLGPVGTEKGRCSRGRPCAAVQLSPLKTRRQLLSWMAKPRPHLWA